MHALIISVKPAGKNTKPENELLKFTESRKLGSEIFKTSVNVELKTSSALTPYYSLKLNLLSSTSHLRFLAGGILAIFKHQRVLRTTDSCSSSICWDIKSSVSLPVNPAQRQIRPTRTNPNPENPEKSASHHKWKTGRRR